MKENSSFENSRDTLKLKIEDSINQFIAFPLFRDITEIKRLILETDFKSLEEYTGKTREELETFKIGVCDAYDGIIPKLQDPDLTLEKLDDLKKEMMAIIR
jgi:hypothetical protein